MLVGRTVEGEETKKKKWTSAPGLQCSAATTAVVFTYLEELDDQVADAEASRTGQSE